MVLDEAGGTADLLYETSSGPPLVITPLSTLAQGLEEGEEEAAEEATVDEEAR